MPSITINLPDDTVMSDLPEIERAVIALATRTGMRPLRKDRVIGRGIEYDLERIYKPNPASKVVQLPVRGQRNPHAPGISPSAA